MRCIVTAGPTYEKLDEVRRITNFSTGELGCKLADALTAAGHHVTLLLGSQSTYRNVSHQVNVREFTTSESLKNVFRELSDSGYKAVFHAAAVCDYKIGRVFDRDDDGNLLEIKSGKYQTSMGRLLVELVPTEKIISKLRGWFPEAIIVGWKYEVDRPKVSLIDISKRQIEENKTDACVMNGPAYGKGFGVLSKQGSLLHYDTKEALIDGLVDFLKIVK
ncbi:MAG: phosphopantothenoylcysteine decarboxylase [Verrucomicrobiia bacterium]